MQKGMGHSQASPRLGFFMHQIFLLAFCSVCRVGFGAQPNTPTADGGKVTYLWPVHFSSVPLSKSKAQPQAFEPEEFGTELRNIGLARFNEYLTSVLPKELEIDKEANAEFQKADHSRINMGFFRWQKRVFADHEGVPVEQLSARGDLAPRLDGINYSWPELYENRAFRKLKTRITELAKLYNKRAGYKESPSKFRIFSWVEVYNKGDALRPGARTDGAYLMGRYFADAKSDSLKMNFEDPRGINPPYGKTFSHPVYQGNMVIFPTWVSHFITPNMGDHTAVCFVFLVYPPGGNTLNWRHDSNADIRIERNLSVGKDK